jgi:hypothetical protein
LIAQDIKHPYAQDRKHIIAFMRAKEGWIGCGNGGILTSEISRLDNTRGQNLKDVAPELAQIIHYNGPIAEYQ